MSRYVWTIFLYACTCFSVDLKGKSFSEKSKLMAQSWREMSTDDKEKYSCSRQAKNMEEEGSDGDKSDFSSYERKKLIHRVIRRLQKEVHA